MNSKGMSASKVKKETKDERIELKRVRCMNCNKMLGKLKGVVEIKCPKCKGYNYFSE